MLKDWLKLLYAKSLSISQKRVLVDRLGSARAVMSKSSSELRQLGLLSEQGVNAIVNASETTIENDIEILNSIGGVFVGFNEPDFPTLLNEIPSPPLGLFCIGNIDLLKQPQIAIVGSRNASPSGRRTTEAFARELSRQGLVITSGLAMGIDSHAHRGCLDANYPTLAVMATGIERVYPRSNQSLYQQICKEGLVVTEFAPGTLPKRTHFPQRNRIISGLSLGTLVAEAGIRSGSLITARLSADQGREVFAIPGSIHMVTSRGCHQLIRDGAKLVESVNDITSELGHFMIDQNQNFTTSFSPINNKCENPLYNLIDYAPISIEQLIELSGLTPEQVSTSLIDLELQGLITETNSGYLRLP